MYDGESNYPWYAIVTNYDPILQGDIFNNCPIIIPSSPVIASGEMSATVLKITFIVITQSCDLQQGKADSVVVCALWPLEEIGKKNSYFNGSEGKEELRKGSIPGYHLLNKIDNSNYEGDFHVVSFRHLYSVPFPFLQEYAKNGSNRVRLLPPYREHLSQAFARFFMRVGLPIDIPSFKKKK